ncbi:MAG: aminopeptidase P family N-terminal domain-containing protein [Pseudomonadota bacterium]
MDKRHFLKLAGAATALMPMAAMARTSNVDTTAQPDFNSLNNIIGDSAPISVEERRARIEKAQSLMKEHNIAAILLEPGAAMDYFSGVQWWRSERLTAVVIPQKGDIAVVTPFFEKPSVMESLKVGDDVRVLQQRLPEWP